MLENLLSLQLPKYQIASLSGGSKSKGYQGYHLLKGGEKALSRIAIEDYDANSFYEDFIAKRKPCIITVGKENDNQKLFSCWKDLDWLRKNVAHESIHVEEKFNNQFGLDRKIEMTFHDFCDVVMEGNHYLTTQYHIENEDKFDEDELILRDLLTPPLCSIIPHLNLKLPLVPDDMVWELKQLTFSVCSK